MSRAQSKSKTAQRRSRLAHSPLEPRGFTLIEMLVAVTLVLIMMAMFAEIFQIAGGSIAKTRGLAENDQRSRTLQTIIKADLDKRSFRWVYPFAAGEDASALESNIGNRQGYFYVSENNPYNSLDDVLQLTVVSSITSRNKDESPYYGQALNIPKSTSSVPNFGYANQPDADDAQSASNNTGISTVAEVVYFVRNGNLYRRQLLVREQLAIAGSLADPNDQASPTPWKFFQTTPAQTSTASPTPPLYPNSSDIPGATTFWDNYDYSAYYNEVPPASPPPASAPSGANFLGTDSLSNAGTVSLTALGAPFRRYGHHHFGLGVTSGHAGRPKEFSANTPGAEFIGRFTLQECSDPQFQYPHDKTAGGNIPTDPTLALTLDNDKNITGPAPDDFSQGPRRGEDLLLSNVHAFDILVWDENYGGFVNIGDPNLPATSDYVLSKRKNISYGPRLPATVSAPTIVNAVFDTWHPVIEIEPDNNQDGTVESPSVNDEPPFRPITFRPDYFPYTTYPGYTEPTPSNGSRPKVWTENTAFLVGDIVFPTAANNPMGTPFYYRCIDTTKAVKPSKKKG